MNKKCYPLSYNQLALWRVYQLAPESTAYNVYSSVKINAPIHLNVWRKAWKKIVQRHGIIRTTYTTRQGQPLQVPHSARRFEPKVIDATHYDKNRLDDIIIRSAEQPFDLEHGPVLRVSLFQQSDEAYIQLLTIHEIAGELRSLNILTLEFQQLYGQLLQALPGRRSRDSSGLSVAS